MEEVTYVYVKELYKDKYYYLDSKAESRIFPNPNYCGHAEPSLSIKALMDRLLCHILTSTSQRIVRNEVPIDLSCISISGKPEIIRPLNNRELKGLQRLVNDNYTKIVKKLYPVK